MRLIDADALKEKISYRQWDVDDDLPRDEASTRISECYVIGRIVDDMPTVDAVPVVRCKDCKWYKTNYSWDGKEHRVCVIEAYEPVRKADDFCSRAERKEE